MEVHGKTKTYKPIKESDDSWDMKVINEENAIYGLSCESLKELRATLLVDYAIGIITKVNIRKTYNMVHTGNKFNNNQLKSNSIEIKKDDMELE